jgi:hypothetical protein
LRADFVPGMDEQGYAGNSKRQGSCAQQPSGTGQLDHDLE